MKKSEWAYTPQKYRYRKQQKYRLSDVVCDEISLVDRPANNRTWILFKKISDDTLDLNDPDVVARLEEEWANMSDEERAEVEKALKELAEKFGLLLDAQAMEIDYRKLKKSDPGLARRVRDFPHEVDWSWEKGFTLRPEFEFKLTKNFNQAKTHFFDSESMRWIPLKGGK